MKNVCSSNRNKPKSLNYPCDICERPERVYKPGAICLKCEHEIDVAESEYQARMAPKPNRKCRECQAPLPIHKYFKCESCDKYSIATGIDALDAMPGYGKCRYEADNSTRAAIDNLDDFEGLATGLR